MEESNQDNDDEVAFPCIPVKPQKTLFSYFNVDRFTPASVQRQVNGVTSEPTSNRTCNEGEKKKKGNKDSDRNSGISISLFGQSAVKRISKTKQQKAHKELHTSEPSGTVSDGCGTEITDDKKNLGVIDRENNNIDHRTDNEEDDAKGENNAVIRDTVAEGSVKKDDDIKEKSLGEIEIKLENGESNVHVRQLVTSQKEVTNEEKSKNLDIEICVSQLESRENERRTSDGIKCMQDYFPSSKNMPTNVQCSSEKHELPGVNVGKDFETNDGTCSDKISEVHGCISSVETGEVHGCTSSGKIKVASSNPDETSMGPDYISSDETNKVHSCDSSDTVLDKTQSKKKREKTKQANSYNEENEDCIEEDGGIVSNLTATDALPVTCIDQSLGDTRESNTSHCSDKNDERTENISAVDKDSSENMSTNNNNNVPLMSNASPNKKCRTKKKKPKFQFDSSDEESCEIDSITHTPTNVVTDANNTNVVPKTAEHDLDGEVTSVLQKEEEGMDTSSNIENKECRTSTDDAKIEIHLEGNIKELPSSKLINKIYPSTSCSKYKSLLRLADKRCETPNVFDNKHSRSVDDCLSLLQSRYPDVAVRKVFQQLLDCQKNNITKNLTKVETTKKLVETIWQRDAELKSEEMALAEEARLKKLKMEEEIALAELKKKRNDIRASFNRGKSKKKKVNVKISDDSSDDEVNKKSTAKGRRKSKTRKDSDVNISSGSECKSNVDDPKVEKSKKSTKTRKRSLKTIDTTDDDVEEGKENLRQGKENKKLSKDVSKKRKKKNDGIVKVLSSGSDGKGSVSHSEVDKIDITGIEGKKGKQKTKKKKASENTIDTYVTKGEKAIEVTGNSSTRKNIKDKPKRNKSINEVQTKNESEKENLEETVTESKEVKKKLKFSKVGKQKKSRGVSHTSVEEGVDCYEIDVEPIECTPTRKKKKTKKEQQVSAPGISEEKVKQKGKSIKSYLQTSNVKVELHDVCTDLLKDTANGKVVEAVVKSEAAHASQTVIDGENTEEVIDEQGSKSTKRKMHRSDSNSKKLKLSCEEPVTRRRSLRNRSQASSKSDDQSNMESTSNNEFTAVIDSCKACKEEISENVTERDPFVEKKHVEAGDASSLVEETENKTPLRRSTRVRKTVILDVPEESESETDVKEDVKETVRVETPECDDDSEVETVGCKEASFDKEASKARLNKVIEQLDLLESPRKSPRKCRPEININEDYMNSCMPWTDKYQPEKARYVIGDMSSSRQVYDWLYSWKERQESAMRKISRTSRQQQSDSESDSDSELSEFEDYLSNTIMLSGPCGCGTTATVYACANQLDFKVLELNPSMYRTGKQIFDQVSEAVVSHQVRHQVDINDVAKQPSQPTPPAPNLAKHNFFSARKGKIETKDEKPENGKQQAEEHTKEKKENKTEKAEGHNKKEKKEKTEKAKGHNKKEKKENKTEHAEKESKADVINIPESTSSTTIVDAMSLVLFEQVDIVYEDIDRGFYQGIADLRWRSKRPIVLTANDPKVLEVMNAEDSWIDHISLTYPSTEKLLPMLQLTCLAEQVFLPEKLLCELISWCYHDIRKVILQLMFWCDQGKEPLYKHWKAKPRKSKKTRDESKEDEIKTDENDEIEIKTTDEIEIGIDNDTVYVTEISNVLPVYECECYVDRDEIFKEGRCSCKNIHGNYSFSKYVVEDVYSALDHIADSADNISELNSRLCGDINSHGMDRFKWTSTLSDSLSDEFCKENNNNASFFTKSIFENVNETYKESYEQYIQNGLDSAKKRVNLSYSNMYKAVLQGDSEKNNIDRRPFLVDTLPYMKKICQLEELNLSTLHHRKRGNRRYKHYLNSSGIEEDVLNQLSTSLL